MMFIIGIGKVCHFHFPRYSYNFLPSDRAQATAKAIETPSIAFAQSLDLFFVQSKSIKNLSKSACDANSLYSICSSMVLLTFSTAFNTPFPRYLDLSSSLNSNASCIHVDAPDGTIAFHRQPFER